MILNMKDNFIVYFNTKKIVMYTLAFLFFGFIMLYIATVIILNMLNGQFDIKQTIYFIPFSALIIYSSFYLLYNTVYIFIKAVLKKEKEAVIINDKGIYRNKLYIFSKPIFIDWNNIDIYTAEYNEYSRRNNKKVKINQKSPIWLFFNNNSICLTLKQEFYDSLSIIDKIACLLTSLTSNGHNFRIRLCFTHGDAKEVISEMKEYFAKK